MEGKKKRKKLYKAGIEKDFKRKIIKARVSEIEYNSIQEKANDADLTVSDFIRKSALGDNGTVFNPKGLIDHFFQFTKAVNKVGVNINQATNYINYLKNQGRASEKEVKEFNELFHRYLDILENVHQLINKEFKKLK